MAFVGHRVIGRQEELNGISARAGVDMRRGQFADGIRFVGLRRFADRLAFENGFRLIREKSFFVSLLLDGFAFAVDMPVDAVRPQGEFHEALAELPLNDL